jgi:hypothetical protein
LFQAAACINVRGIFAGIAQLVEQLICNQQVVGSNPTAGSIIKSRLTSKVSVECLDIFPSQETKEIAFFSVPPNDTLTIW